MSIDVEIYITQLTKFFENNVNDLVALIDDVSRKDVFYAKVRERAYQNYEKTQDVILTQTQFRDIVMEMHEERKKNNIFFHCKLGILCMN